MAQLPTRTSVMGRLPKAQEVPNGLRRLPADWKVVDEVSLLALAHNPTVTCKRMHRSALHALKREGKT